jgi:hypothetical protein
MGTTKRKELLETAGAAPTDIYALNTPGLELGLPFTSVAVSAGYFAWPKLPELLPVSFPLALFG